MLFIFVLLVHSPARIALTVALKKVDHHSLIFILQLCDFGIIMKMFISRKKVCVHVYVYVCVCVCNLLLQFKMAIKHFFKTIHVISLNLFAFCFP